MRVVRASVRDFRNYERLEATFGPSLTVVTGANGAGKTNLLEAVYFGCTGRSPRTSNERELVRRGAKLTRVAMETADADGEYTLEVGLEPGQPKHLRIDGHAVESMSSQALRPLVSVFLPERLELVKGPPSPRRGHLDQLIAAIWPARAETRTDYGRALAQRNALLGRVRSGTAGVATLDAWDAALARHGIQLMAERREVVADLQPLFTARAGDLGLPGTAELRYRPRSGAVDESALMDELSLRRQADLERGFTAHGPHRDDLQLLLGELSLRSYGSQGQQRSALLALLFAERDLFRQHGAALPMMLLDDVMSELDKPRRELLASLVDGPGQTLITTTDVDQVPRAAESGAVLFEVAGGSLQTRTAPPRALRSGRRAA